MFSNGNPYFPQGQYFPQALQYIPGAYGAYGTSPYGNSGFGPEFVSPGFGQQVPVGGPLAAFSPSQSPGQSIGPQLITALSQLANQVVAQGVAAQQVGLLLGQLTQQILTQQIVAQASYGNAGVVPPGLQGNPFIGTQAFNPLQRFGGQGIGAAFGQSPYAAPAPVGFGGFGPQMQVPQNQAWAINRPAVLQ